MLRQITMLNVMAGGEFMAALDQLKAWGLEVVDLKNGIYGKSIAELTGEEAESAAQALRERSLSVYCLSTELFYDDIEAGERHFRERHLAGLDNVLLAAAKLRPSLIRLLAAKTSRRAQIGDSAEYIRKHAPWVLDVYREAVDRIHAAGFGATIENEAHNCIWASPQEIAAFFAELQREGKAHLTYDVQNLWQMGTFPSLQAYEELKPLIGYLHLKGGQTDGGSAELAWSSALEDASWPVADIVKRAISDNVSPVICLNPSHGRRKADYDYTGVTARDLAFIRKLVEGVVRR